MMVDKKENLKDLLETLARLVKEQDDEDRRHRNWAITTYEQIELAKKDFGIK